jgi:hypothetical protein
MKEYSSLDEGVLPTRLMSDPRRIKEFSSQDKGCSSVDKGVLLTG